MKIRIDFFSMILLCFCLMISLSSFGQLTVDVGKDTTYCSDPNTTSIPMGLKISIKNGVEPYTLAWECLVVPYGILKPQTASYVLNDSTILSPSIINGAWLNADKIKFILNLADHAGNYAKDSINAGFSGCAYIQGYQVKFLNKGDSIWLDAGTPQGRFAAYYWEPSYGLSNPGSSATWCKPDVTTSYFITAIDTSGCRCSNLAYEIRIITTDTNTKINPESKINPFQKGSKVYFNNKINQEALVSMFSLDGKLLHQCSSNTDNIEVSELLPKRGTYIVKITIKEEVGTCRFISQ
jgi:hypothetical protein